MHHRRSFQYKFNEGPPKKVVTPENTDAVRELIKKGPHVTYPKIQTSLGHSYDRHQWEIAWSFDRRKRIVRGTFRIISQAFKRRFVLTDVRKYSRNTFKMLLNRWRLMDLSIRVRNKTAIDYMGLPKWAKSSISCSQKKPVSLSWCDSSIGIM